MISVAKRHHNLQKMNKKAWTISWAELIGLILVVFVLFTFCQSDAFKNLKKLVIKDIESGAKEQLEYLITYINANIERIKLEPQAYPIDIDGDKYVITVTNCETYNEGKDVGKCKDKKTRFCLKRTDIKAKEYCSKKGLDFLVSENEIRIPSKNLLIGWDKAGKKLIISPK